mmetsp:Transcript_99405/g.286905  ORF Transcript_99405/g.286905 Transcript_99405/m.286905 type:complete len:785 (-) Transcript_99405:299-2653(-)
MAMLDLEVDLDAAALATGLPEAELQQRLQAAFSEASRMREILRPAPQQAHGGAEGTPPAIVLSRAGEPPPVLPTPSDSVGAGGGAEIRANANAGQDVAGVLEGADASSLWSERSNVGDAAFARYGEVGSGVLGDLPGGGGDVRAQLGSSPRSCVQNGAWAPGAASGQLSAERARIRRSIWELNHPTTPVSPSFLADGSYWQQRSGNRLRELRLQEDLRNLRQDEVGEPFHASPPPVATTAPRFQAMQAAEAARRGRSVELVVSRRRARSADVAAESRGSRAPNCPPFVFYGTASAAARATRPRSSSPTRRGGRAALDAREDSPPPFRAKPVPISAVAPLYEQMLAQERELREERRRERCKALLRTASLPPRLEAEKAKLLAEEAAKSQKVADAQAGLAPANAAMRRPRFGSAMHLSRPPIPSEQAPGPEAPPVPPGPPEPGSVGPEMPPGFAAVFGEDLLAASVLGDALGIGGGSVANAPLTKQRAAPKVRREVAERKAALAMTYRTGEVPDFATLHEKDRKQLEMRKMMNRRTEPPAPFHLHAPQRGERQRRQPPLPKDPAEDWRFRRAQARASSSGARLSAGGGGGGDAPGVNGLPAAMVPPPRTTVKTAMQHMYTIQKLVEVRRRELEQAQQDFQRANAVSTELKMRVRQFVGPPQRLSDKIEDLAMEKRLDTKRTTRQQLMDLERIKERVERRPLLMEQVGGQSRARRRALFKVRSALESAGVRNPDAMFHGEELDELELAIEREGARTANEVARAAKLVEEAAASASAGSVSPEMSIDR